MNETLRELAARGVQGQLAVDRDAFPALDKFSGAVTLAKSEGLEPGQRMKAEAVVELRHVDVLRLQVRPRPEMFRR